MLKEKIMHYIHYIRGLDLVLPVCKTVKQGIPCLGPVRWILLCTVAGLHRNQSEQVLEQQ